LKEVLVQASIGRKVLLQSTIALTIIKNKNKEPEFSYAFLMDDSDLITAHCFDKFDPRIEVAFVKLFRSALPLCWVGFFIVSLRRESF
jgi:hypothetical protein